VPATDPALEKRVMAIAEELRCLVCQNETLAGSQAALAVDLRAQIRGQLREGRTQQQILDFMAARYGDFVLYRPPLGATTWLLWGGPFALLVLGGWMVRHRLRATAATPPPVLTPEERARARRLLAQEAPSP
jgi:cytochrome c-type biogenesis protein CcmH